MLQVPLCTRSLEIQLCIRYGFLAITNILPNLIFKIRVLLLSYRISLCQIPFQRFGQNKPLDFITVDI